MKGRWGEEFYLGTLKTEEKKNKGDGNDYPE